MIDLFVFVIFGMFGLAIYMIIGWLAWGMFECKHYGDGYTRWRDGSGLAYTFGWPIIAIKGICKGIKRAFKM